MRLTTRVSTGLFLMAGLLIASLTYQLAQIERLQGINEEVSRSNLEGARMSLQLLQALDGVQEFSSKYKILPDSLYQAQWSAWENAVDEVLLSLAALGLDGPEGEAQGRIEIAWAQYLNLATFPEVASGAPLSDEALAEIHALLGNMRVEVGELIAANEAAVAEQAATSAEASERARSIAWLSAVSALLLAAFLSFLLYRWISDPLRHLTRGTREIARGRFNHRLRIQGPTELSDLARDFDRMAVRLHELDELKKDFVSHVSHELKTPLAAVQETIELLLEEIAGPLKPKQVHLLELSRSSAARLSGMITDLLEMSRLEAGAAGFIPAWNDVSEIARSAIEEVDLLAADKAVVIRHRSASTDDWEIVCDRDRIRDVLTNLLGNAVKFAPVGGSVEATLSQLDSPPPGCPLDSEAMKREKGPFLMLSVHDGGPGVPDEEKERIFEKFHQVRDGARLGPGVGLGLAISRHIVEAHSGGLWVEDRAPAGSVFRVLLPRIPSRWFDRLDNQSQSHSSELEVGSRVAPGDAARRVALSLILAPILSGCGGGQPALASTPDPEPLGTQVATSSESGREILLSTGWLFLSYGDFEGAQDRFQGAMEGEGTSRLTGEAVWGMVLIHLLPESPFFDRERAESLLTRLQAEYPDAAAGVLAAWVQRLLADLEEVRVMVDTQEEALRRLTETVDQLREIDRSRSPQGVTAPTSR